MALLTPTLLIIEFLASILCFCFVFVLAGVAQGIVGHDLPFYFVMLEMESKAFSYTSSSDTTHHVGTAQDSVSLWTFLFGHLCSFLFFFLLTASIYVLLSELCLILYSRPQHPFLQRKRVKRPRRKPEGAEPREKGSGSQRMSASAVVMVDSWCYATESSAPRPTTSPAWAWASGPLVGAQHPCSF